MKVRLSIIIFLLLWSCVITAQTVFRTDHLIGETRISTIENCYNQCNRNIIFLNVHDNERTSVAAAQQYLNTKKGLLVTISNNIQRNINFTIGSQNFSFDPNRIFSEEGRIATLKTNSPSPYNDEAELQVSYFADEILREFIDSSKLIVALHNNTDSNLSVLTYQQDQIALPNSGKVFINPLMDPDDFILTTDTTIFNFLAERNINAVWENNTIIKDDGSLSVYAGLHGIPYLNIEAQHEHLDEQLRLLQVVGEIIDGILYNRKERDTADLITSAQYRLAPDK